MYRWVCYCLNPIDMSKTNQHANNVLTNWVNKGFRHYVAL